MCPAATEVTEIGQKMDEEMEDIAEIGLSPNLGREPSFQPGYSAFT